MTGRGPLVQAGAWQPLCHGAAESSEQAVKLAKPKTVLIWPFSENICWSLPYSVRLLLLPGSPPCASSPPKRHPSKAAAGPEQGAALSRSDAGWEGRSSLVPPPSPRSERRVRCPDTCPRHGRPRITCGRGHRNRARVSATGRSAALRGALSHRLERQDHKAWPLPQRPGAVPACGGTVGWNSRGLNVLFSHGVLGPRLCLGGD